MFVRRVVGSVRCVVLLGIRVFLVCATAVGNTAFLPWISNTLYIRFDPDFLSRATSRKSSLGFLYTRRLNAPESSVTGEWELPLSGLLRGVACPHFTLIIWCPPFICNCLSIFWFKWTVGEASLLSPSNMNLLRIATSSLRMTSFLGHFVYFKTMLAKGVPRSETSSSFPPSSLSCWPCTAPA